jgi:hypothetical protein
MGERVAERFGKAGFLRHLPKPPIEPELEVFHQRLCLGLPYRAPNVRRLAANAIFDGVELTDAPDGLGRNRRSGRDIDVLELATRMGEAKQTLRRHPGAPDQAVHCSRCNHRPAEYR